MVEEIANRVPEQKEHNEKESRRRVDWKISSRKCGPKSTKKAVEETEKKESITKRSVTKENIEAYRKEEYRKEEYRKEEYRKEEYRKEPIESKREQHQNASDADQ